MPDLGMNTERRDFRKKPVAVFVSGSRCCLNCSCHGTTFTIKHFSDAQWQPVGNVDDIRESDRQGVLLFITLDGPALIVCFYLVEIGDDGRCLCFFMLFQYRIAVGEVKVRWSVIGLEGDGQVTFQTPAECVFYLSGICIDAVIFPGPEPPGQIQRIAAFLFITAVQ